MEIDLSMYMVSSFNLKFCGMINVASVFISPQACLIFISWISTFIAAKEYMHQNIYFKIKIGVLVSASVIDDPSMFHGDYVNAYVMNCFAVIYLEK